MRFQSCVALLLALPALPTAAETSSEATQLANEVRSKGWIVFPSRSEKGDWDLFLMRPDGSQKRSLTSTPEWNESAPQFSRDGKFLLYRRLKRDENIDGNRYGEQGSLVIANSDGSNPRVLGGEGEFGWASWSPDGRELACLGIKGITFVDVTTGKVVRSLPRNGFFQQLTWSPDGKWLSGVSNSFGTGWSVARMDSNTGKANAVSRVDCCTPDWFPDSGKMIFSNRHASDKNGQTGWTQLWMADADGNNPKLVYAEDGRHIYGGHVSPDAQYVLFTGNPQEDGDPSKRGAPMNLMRLSDAPLIGGNSQTLHSQYPKAKSGPLLSLPEGWEPCWTYHEIPLPPTSKP